MSEITFIATESAKDLLIALGIPMSGQAFEPCPLNVGDLISYPQAPLEAFRVIARWYRAAGEGKPAVWYLTVERAGDPLAEDPHAPEPHQST